jgi:hypothetical protein
MTMYDRTLCKTIFKIFTENPCQGSDNMHKITEFFHHCVKKVYIK